MDLVYNSIDHDLILCKALALIPAQKYQQHEQKLDSHTFKLMCKLAEIYSYNGIVFSNKLIKTLIWNYLYQSLRDHIIICIFSIIQLMENKKP